MQAAAVLVALAASPAGRVVLELARPRPDVHVVGGFVRDVLLSRVPREIDVVIEGDALELGRELAVRLGSSAVEHGRFGTAIIRHQGERIDLASARSEVYPAPGALPTVTPGAALEQDLLRRDFTVNTLAVTVGGPGLGVLRAPGTGGVGAAAGEAAAGALGGALEDLAGGRLRVLHERSFVDDPTRLLRLARYGERLGFEPEPRTAALAGEAIAGGRLSSVSGPRLGAELRTALEEPDPLDVLASLERLGVLGTIDPRLRCDAPLARSALVLLPGDGSPGLLALAACAGGFEGPEQLRGRLDELSFPSRDRDVIVAAALRASDLGERLAAARRPSELYAAAAGQAVETIALAGAQGALAGAQAALAGASRWLGELRHVSLQITGDDLLAAGVPPGPEVGRRMRSALSRKLDGEIASDAGAELDAALAG